MIKCFVKSCAGPSTSCGGGGGFSSADPKRLAENRGILWCIDSFFADRLYFQREKKGKFLSGLIFVIQAYFVCVLRGKSTIIKMLKLDFFLLKLVFFLFESRFFA